MPELDTGSGRTAEGPPVGDHAATEPGSDREHHEVLHTATGPGAPFADRRRIRVVVEPNRQAEPGRHPVAKRKILQRQVHALDDHAPDLVDRRGSPESDRRDLVAQKR